MIIFPSILALSLIGIAFITRTYRLKIKSYSQAELMLQMETVPSLRSQLRSHAISPMIQKAEEVIRPIMFRTYGKLLGNVRGWVSKLESRLHSISEDIHGTAINLNIPEKSEYWQNLNIAKTANAHHDIVPRRAIK